ncbi:cytochrome B [Mucilaginibacter sp. S1162]|uniref:Cytochrome B n=1 Tax=Mucilaginibacter humi TaxID=2732510 RepID=A0ABX1W2K3_9SPHI|nr:cytochrome B [Mucilaginibacter humi]NNU34094.1 cytochrome B [Mucilaginibacter humi]
MNAYSFVQHLHSGFRYIVLVLFIYTILQAFIGWLAGRPYDNRNRLTNLFAMISAHTQLLIGIVLYFLSPLVAFNSTTMKDPVTRYFTMEHGVMMLIALVLITIGHSKSKKLVLPEAKHKTIALFYTLALLIIIGTLAAGKISILK